MQYDNVFVPSSLPTSMEESTHLLAKKIQEIPPIEFSYETYYSHRKEQSSSKYNVGLLIPKSKKYIAWFTFLGEKDVCILLELNREKQIVQHKIINVVFDQTQPHLALGTFLYGSIYIPDASIRSSTPESPNDEYGKTYFVVEDIFMYKSVSLRKLCFGFRLAILSHILSDISTTSSASLSEYRFVLPMMFDLSDQHQEKNTFPDIQNVLSQVCYPIHKIQYRSFTEIIPYMNYDLYLFTAKPPKYDKKNVMIPSEPSVASWRNVSEGANSERHVDRRSGEFGRDIGNYVGAEISGAKLPDFQSGKFASYRCTRNHIGGLAKPEEKRPIMVEKERDIFMVSADIQSDIYYLNHIHGKYRPDLAYIPNYKTSVFMNSLFRMIKENVNLDTMEESDDEEEFQDIRMEKYVNLEKCIPMECMYHRKFKRWIPIRPVVTK
jgi:hypothetical protein